MINAPKPGTVEFTAHLEEEKRQADVQERFLRLHQDHEVHIKELELALKKSEVSLTASLNLILKVLTLPFFLLAIIPITIMVLSNKQVPPELWKAINGKSNT